VLTGHQSYLNSGCEQGSAGSQELVVLQAMNDADGVGSQKTDN
jgi:hypothetical protein